MTLLECEVSLGQWLGLLELGTVIFSVAVILTHSFLRWRFLTIIPPTLESLDVICMMGVCIESRNVRVHVRTRAVFDIGDTSILVAMETLERRVAVHGERSAPVLHHQCSVRSWWRSPRGGRYSSPSPSAPARRASSGSSGCNRVTFLVVEDGEGGGGRSMVRMTKSMHGRLVVWLQKWLHACEQCGRVMSPNCILYIFYVLLIVCIMN